jgi:hypothetical protein
MSKATAFTCFARLYRREAVLRPANVAMAISADETAMTHSTKATPGVLFMSATPIAPRRRADPNPT